ARRNVDLSYIVMNNQIYGLTTGQVSPTSSTGMKTKSTPFGSVEYPMNPLTSAIMNGATYVGRGYSGDIRGLTDLIKGAIQHKGFSLVDVFSPCVTFNLDNDHPFFKQRIKKLGDVEHDPSDWKVACERAMEWGDTIYTGLFFERSDRDSLDALEPILEEATVVERQLGLTDDQKDHIRQRLM
ncbi:MAG: thiamine pyrophosphate-dependent enzyme, partial [Dehalococcoidia bacterium]